jgi:hypothetical protein
MHIASPVGMYGTTVWTNLKRLGLYKRTVRLRLQSSISYQTNLPYKYILSKKINAHLIALNDLHNNRS